MSSSSLLDAFFASSWQDIDFSEVFYCYFLEKQSETLLATLIRLQMQYECSSTASRTTITIFLSLARGNKINLVLFRISFVSFFFFFYRTVNS